MRRLRQVLLGGGLILTMLGAAAVLEGRMPEAIAFGKRVFDMLR